VCASDSVKVFIRREDAECSLEDVRGDDPELASYLRIEERELGLAELASSRHRRFVIALGFHLADQGDRIDERLVDEHVEEVAELPSEVLDVETPFGVDRDSVAHLVQPEARLRPELQRDHVVLTWLHGPSAAGAT
jgi:hypothetical protein